MADGPTWRPKPTGRHWLPCPALEHGTWTIAPAHISDRQFRNILGDIARTSE